MDEQDDREVSRFQNFKRFEILKYINIERDLSSAATVLGNKLNKEIDRGNTTLPFIIALILAIIKDILDASESLVLIMEGFIPGVGEALDALEEIGVLGPISICLNVTLYLMMRHNGSFINTKVKITFWVLSLFSDIPIMQLVPFQTISILYTWHVVRKRRDKAALKLANLNLLTQKEISDLDANIEMLDQAETTSFAAGTYKNVSQSLNQKINKASKAELRSNLKIEQKRTGVKKELNKQEIQRLSNTSIPSTHQKENVRAAQIEQANNVSLNNQRNRIQQGAREERGSIASSILNNGVDLIPIFGGGKMFVEAIAGRELGGQKISGKERIIHAAVGISSIGLDIFTLGAGGDIEREAFLAGKSAKLVEGMGGKLAEKGIVKSSDVFMKTAKFMTDHPELTEQAEHYADKKIKEKIKDVQKYREGERPQYENRT